MVVPAPPAPSYTCGSYVPSYAGVPAPKMIPVMRRGVMTSSPYYDPRAYRASSTNSPVSPYPPNYLSQDEAQAMAANKPSGSRAEDGAPLRKKLKLSQQSFQDSTKVIVGKESAQFLIPTFFLTTSSDFFKTACSERWECGRTREIELKEESPEIVAVFFAWALTGDIHNAEGFEALTDGCSEQAMIERWDQLAKCFVLGDMLQAPVFCNLVIDELVGVSSRHDTLKTTVLGTLGRQLQYISENTVEDSPLRKMILDNVISKVSVNDFSAEKYAPFLLELARKATIKARIGFAAKASWERDSCNYHSHPDKPADYICKKT